MKSSGEEVPKLICREWQYFVKKLPDKENLALTEYRGLPTLAVKSRVEKENAVDPQKL